MLLFYVIFILISGGFIKSTYAQYVTLHVWSSTYVESSPGTSKLLRMDFYTNTTLRTTSHCRLVRHRSSAACLFIRSFFRTSSYQSQAWAAIGREGRVRPPVRRNSSIFTMEVTKSRGWAPRPPPHGILKKWLLALPWIPAALPSKISCLRPWYRPFINFHIFVIPYRCSDIGAA